ncbi:hypothetical protein B0H14DRAFT_3130736 [Mycena olivaceomarginata]|nr:hypothetical protein B0H14DRAFT_3130736 [Mycena olivaceomarginata]
MAGERLLRAGRHAEGPDNRTLRAGQHVEDRGSARKRGARGSAREGRGSAREGAVRAPRVASVRRGRYGTRKDGVMCGRPQKHVEAGERTPRAGRRKKCRGDGGVMHAESRYRVERRGGVPKARVACKVSEASAEDEAALAAGGGEWAEGGEPCGTRAQCAVTLGNAGKGGAASTEGGVAPPKARAARGTRTGGANCG